MIISNRWKLYCDGSSHGNPGLSAGGAYLIGPGNNYIGTSARYIGKNTNNMAEYVGVLVGLELAQKINATHIDVYTDSRLVVEQVNGRWKVNESKFEPFIGQIRIILNLTIN